MRLIDGDEMRENLEWCKSQSGQYNDIYWDDVIERLDAQPTVEAAPVRHGKWTTKRTQKHNGEWYCTVCDYEPIVMSDDMKYCPGCGAEMDLEG